MERLSIRCLACDKGWWFSLVVSFYEQQAVESRPCPGCGAYTLSCTEQKLTRRQAAEEAPELVSAST